MRAALTRTTYALGVGLILGVAAAGCGGGSSSSSSSSDEVAPTVITPKGAPYSYGVPNGFEEIPGDFPEGEEPEFLTLVVPEGVEGEGNLNTYQWGFYGGPEESFGGKRLLRYLDTQTRIFYRTVGATVGPTKEETVAGHPAVCWKITGFENKGEGLVDADSCAIAVEPGLAVEQSCSWKPATKAAMQKGCAELRASLKVGAAAE
jgi:hypothetical protein